MPPRRIATSMIPVAVEPRICPDAVRCWMDGLVKYEKKSKKERDEARGHMSAMGWKFWRPKLKGDKLGELRYESPVGKFYYLLKTACQACVELEHAGFESMGSNSSYDPNSPQSLTEETQITMPKREERQETIPRKSGRPRKNETKMNDCAEDQDQIDNINTLDSDPDYVMKEEEEECKEGMCYLSSLEKPKKRGRKRKIDLVTKKPGAGKFLAHLKRLRLEEEHPKVQLRSPRTVLSSLIDNKIVAQHAKVYYNGRRQGDIPLATGQIAREGILCDCCANVFALTAFEAHAGSTNHRPGANIIIEENGRSIADCQQELKRLKDTKKVYKKKKKKNAVNFDKIDDLCSLCHSEGELVLCDGCPSAFHVTCLGLSEVAYGEWFCPACSCGICGSGKIEQGSIPGVIRKCDQCEHKYHVGCLKNNEVASQENWFCSKKCQNIMMGLKKLLGQRILVGDNNLTWTLLKSSSTTRSDSRETHKRLRAALKVLHKCFEPSVDPYTQRDLVEDIILNKEMSLRRLNFRGFYTVLLERKSEVICVATVRVYGEVAEVPLVATMWRHRRLGMCRILMKELETQLSMLGVERLVLPSSHAALETWTNTSMGFSEMPQAEKPQFINYFFLYFTDTILCHKFLTQKNSVAATQATASVESMDLDDDSSDGISEITQTDEEED